MENTIRVSTGNFRYAGIGVRALAALIDCLILFVLIIIFMSGMVFEFFNNMQNTANLINLGIGKLIILFVYHVGSYFLISATPGQWLRKIKVVNSNGSKMSLMKNILRFICYLLSFFTLGIGFLMIVFSDKKEALHDKIMKTLVIYRR